MTKAIHGIAFAAVMIMKHLMLILLISLFTGTAFGQYNWKLEKDKDGIKVYSSDVPKSDFKATKVDCTITGNYSKLVSILTNVSQFDNWIYHSKTSRLLKKYSPYDIIYHSETEMPWPFSNRDIVIHLRVNTDSLPKFLTINSTSEPDLVPRSGKVRVVEYSASWKVTMPTAQSIHIDYLMQVDPGGSMPGWVANIFVGKGPFETFNNLAKKLIE